MREDVTTPAIVKCITGLYEAGGGTMLPVSAKEIAERTGLPLGTVSGWLSKKAAINKINWVKVDGSKSWFFDPHLELASPAPKKRGRPKGSVTQQRRKPGAEYAEVIHREGINVVLIGPHGELIKGVVV